MTIAFLEGKTEEEVYHFIVEKLAEQGFERSVVNEGEGGGCAYRGKDGRKCAVGFIVTDEEIAEAWRKVPTDKYFGSNSMGVWEFDISRKWWHFLQYVQKCHDAAMTPEDMKQRLKQLGSDKGFTRNTLLNP